MRLHQCRVISPLVSTTHLSLNYNHYSDQYFLVVLCRLYQELHPIYFTIDISITLIRPLHPRSSSKLTQHEAPTTCQATIPANRLAVARRPIVTSCKHDPRWESSHAQSYTDLTSSRTKAASDCNQYEPQKCHIYSYYRSSLTRWWQHTVKSYSSDLTWSDMSDSIVWHSV